MFPGQVRSFLGRAARVASVALAAALATSACAAVHELTHVEAINFSAGTITGFVTDSTSGRPVEGAAVVLLTATGDSVRGQQYKAFGFPPDARYNFATVRPGAYMLRAEAAGYASKSFAIGEVVAGQRHTVSFALRRQ